MKFKPKCVLFDLDGTLVDTAPDLGHAADMVRAELGLPPLPVTVYRPVASAGARGLLKVALGIGTDHPGYARHRDSFLNYYRDNIARASRLFDGMDELLHDFERREIRWGVVTNKPGWLTQLLMDALKLSARAACALSPEAPLKPKPAPDMLLKACELLKLKPAACVYVGDDRRDIDAARNAAMPSVAADWGYLGEGGPVQGWNADVIAATPADLRRLLLPNPAHRISAASP